MPPEASILADQMGGVITLTLNRPGKLNAIDNALAEELLAQLESAAADPSVSAILLRGEGRAFCAGRDVSAPPTDRDLELVQAVACAIVEMPKPVVAAVHGWVVGAGLEWMLDADIAIAAEHTRFKLPEAQLGVFVTGGLVATLPAAAGLARAKALMLLGEPFEAQQACEWGILQQVVPAKELQSTAMQLCERLAALRPEVAAQFKRVLNQFGRGDFRKAIEEESAVQRLLTKGQEP